MNASFDFSKIRALTFDCYGTLIDWETGLLNSLRPWLLAQGGAISEDEIFSAFAEAEASEEARMPDKEYPLILESVFKALSKRWTLNTSESDARAFGCSVPNWPPFADSTAALRRLHKKFKLCILSNVDRDSFAATERALGVTFDLVVTAQDVGTYKPNLKNFHALLGRLSEIGISRDQILHVAESLFHDHVPAQSLGLKTCWIDRRAGRGGGASAAQQVSVTPHLIFHHLKDLANAAGV